MTTATLTSPSDSRDVLLTVGFAGTGDADADAALADGVRFLLERGAEPTGIEVYPARRRGSSVPDVIATGFRAAIFFESDVDGAALVYAHTTNPAWRDFSIGYEDQIGGEAVFPFHRGLRDRLLRITDGTVRDALLAFRAKGAR